MRKPPGRPPRGRRLCQGLAAALVAACLTLLLHAGDLASSATLPGAACFAGLFALSFLDASRVGP